ncbi:hypothetical protein [Streptomyces sp. NBC_00102]|uniref:hypothetical protein n=1 Tax=Streptomyces sp. NBC_00102 TaxID=2975652 RepID=UPI002B1E3083|nr:hypothetical protein [Streptomyces sp. NBC_00102]
MDEGTAPMSIRVVVTGRTVVPTGGPTGRGVDATTLVPLVGAVVGSPTAAAFHTSTGASAPVEAAAPAGAAVPARPGTGSPTSATPPAPAPPPVPAAAPAPGTVRANAAGMSATRRSAPPAEAAPLPRRIPPPPARPPAAAGHRAPHAAGTLTLSADGGYAARLTMGGSEALGRGWYPERWTLDGPEPYAVPLPLDQPEEPDSQVVPLADGRVLIRRRVADRHAFSLLYPTGPKTGELALGTVECERMTLLAPAPDGASVYALAPGIFTTSVWRVAGGTFGPEHVADVPGLCSGGVWLDRTGRVLALDRRPPGGGPVKTVAVDLERGGEVTPLLQIAPESNDRLLIAEPDSGLFLLRSDAPGQDRLGWGVLGSALPVRFPECLRAADADVTVTPFAVQPGQMLMPESCAVALRIDGAAGSWLGVWRPTGRLLHQFVAPAGWSAGAGSWSRDGVLSLPYSRPDVPCGLARLEAPEDVPPEPYGGARCAPGAPNGTPGTSGAQPSADGSSPVGCRPVPLGQAPLHGGPASG